MHEPSSPAYKRVQVTPTLDTNAYSANDRVGTVHTLTAACINGRAAKLASLSVLDKAAQGAALTLLFFDSLPTVASDDNAALDITDAMMEKCKGHVTIGTGDYQAIAASKIACVKNIGLILESGSQGNLYVVVMTTGTPTYAADSLVFNYSFEQGL